MKGSIVGVLVLVSCLTCSLAQVEVLHVLQQAAETPSSALLTLEHEMETNYLIGFLGSGEGMCRSARRLPATFDRLLSCQLNVWDKNRRFDDSRHHSYLIDVQMEMW